MQSPVPETLTYIGGDFTCVGPNTGHGVPLDNATGRPVTVFPKVNGEVYVSIPDGSGGWYIGGGISKVGESSRSNIAHILADGTVDAAWNPRASSSVSALAISGTTVYAGGLFTTIGGRARNRIAALDATTGNATDWNPNANDQVNSLAISGTTVYAGGLFTTIGGRARNRIAALDATTGNATDWNPNANDQVNSLAVSGTTVYVGGLFTSIGGQTRNNIAALDATTGNATDWNPNANHGVIVLAVLGTTVYIGGGFTTVGGQKRNEIAALDTASGNPLDWNPNANGQVRSLAVSGTTVYAGGTFTSIGGQLRSSIAALDAATGSALAWNPTAWYYNGVSCRVNTLAVSGSQVYAGGSFISIGGQPRNNIAALDAQGVGLDWNPDASGTVNALVASGMTVYAGGDFTNIGGQTRNRVAALDATTGNATAWNPNADNTVSTFAVTDTAVYAGGLFAGIGNQTRNGIAALDPATGNATAWNPGVVGAGVNVLALSGGVVYAGGQFTTVGGQTRNNIAAINAETGDVTDWNPNADDLVSALAVSGSTIYVGGGFADIGGQARSYIAALDAETGNATDWNPTPDSLVYALAISGTTVYAGGTFASIGGQARNHIAALNSITGDATIWTANTDSFSASVVSDLAVSETKFYAVGSFRSISNKDQSSLAAFDLPYALTITPPTNGKVTAVPVMPDGRYPEGTTVTLTASANKGYVFDAWTDANGAEVQPAIPPVVGSGTIVMNGAKTVSAAFVPETTPPTGTIVINSNRSATNTASVTLGLTWDDGVFGSGVSRMRFSNDGASWSGWEVLLAMRPYTLPPGADGHRTVRVQYLDKLNNRSAVYSDYIRLDTTPPTGSIIINGGAATTANRSVTLGLNWADTGALVSRMRFSDDGAHWTAWVAPQSSQVHTLPGPVGYNTVRVQYLDGAGNYSAVYNDYIKLVAP